MGMDFALRSEWGADDRERICWSRVFKTERKRPKRAKDLTMTHRILTLTAALLFASTHVSADIIAQGLELKPASSSELTLERIDSASEDMLTLRAVSYTHLRPTRPLYIS